MIYTIPESLQNGGVKNWDPPGISGKKFIFSVTFFTGPTRQSLFQDSAPALRAFKFICKKRKGVLDSWQHEKGGHMDVLFIDGTLEEIKQRFTTESDMALLEKADVWSYPTGAFQISEDKAIKEAFCKLLRKKGFNITWI